MSGFLIFILIVVALYYIGKWYLRRKINRFFNQFGGQFNGQQNTYNGSGQSSQHRTSRKSSKKNKPQQTQSKKVFAKDEGEYVDFVEIKEGGE